MGAELSKQFEEVDRKYEEDLKRLREEQEAEEEEEEPGVELDSGKEPDLYVRPIDDPSYKGPQEDPEEEKKLREANINTLTKILESKERLKEDEEEDEAYLTDEELFERDLPKDPENWREEDTQELWGDAPPYFTKQGWDPYLADDDDIAAVEAEWAAGRDPLVAPFYVPYRQDYPVIPDNHYDIQTPRDVIEELDRTEEFLKWGSFVFQDGSTYEGTIWDDYAHGRGVYVGLQDLVRYEGEWFQNIMEGHGILEIDIPLDQPVPGSKLEAKMRKEGHIILRDYMAPEERRWLEMDIEDTIRFGDGFNETPWYESDDIVKHFGSKPETGHYRYAGQWKHGKFHGCGVYQVNFNVLSGRFYFGQYVEDDELCHEDMCAMHSGLADVAAAKARMFINKPDGMVREERGPYNDPQHPYMYEGDDMWMAPGFIHQFYEVPDFWKRYVREVDKEREMWLNAFNKSPLRVPGPSELEYAWENFEPEEYVLVGTDPEANYDDLSAKDDVMILHIPTGRLINYIPDEKSGVRFFWQPHLEEGEEPDLSKVEFIPFGYDELFNEKQERDPRDEHIVMRVLNGLENILVRFGENMLKWCEEKKKQIDLEYEVAREEYELKMAEMELEHGMKLLEEEKKDRMGFHEEDTSKSEAAMKVEEREKEPEPGAEEEEEEEDGEDDAEAASSFGDVDLQKDTGNGDKSGNSGFATLSSQLVPRTSASMVPSQELFNGEGGDIGCSSPPISVSFTNSTSKMPRLRMSRQTSCKSWLEAGAMPLFSKYSRSPSSWWQKHVNRVDQCDPGSVLSLHNYPYPPLKFY